ncbi:aminopeptidase n-like protein [Plakobranchus ocellatus]|uniref:Aminopeptidase n=1 Tax=Plakobranchus ocellatus TaxID=259542 RepID=A0AAV4BPI9_9GAST|nr:aminopeptidase n-like protein [Plakobranchus ocellatus]
MMEQLEEKCFLDESETILNKKAVYEPTKGQRFRQVVCTRGWAIATLMMTGTVLVGVALIAAFARPAMAPCEVSVAGDNSAALAASAAAGGAASSESSSSKHDKEKGGEEQTYVATNGEPFPWKELRLPKTLVPQAYDIFLHPNISRSEFSGQVEMILRVMEETDAIVFHVNELNISNVAVHMGKSNTTFSQALAIVKQLEYKTNQQFYVQLAERVSAGSFLKVVVKFSGELKRDVMDGFYQSSYTVNGEERYMASTQFEATDARKAFPCLDEPALKATFKLSIVREKKHISLFNMPLMTSEPYGESPNLILDKYNPSPKMSTYLVAFIVCDFKNVSALTRAGTLVRVFAPEDKIYMGKYALDAAVAVLENYTSFFGLPYDLPKADLIAIPNFEAGAMENWGLITYRDTAILYDPAISSQDSKKWVTQVVAHELAHQWFGNLVTMDWWDDLWLNEGFATFVEFLGMDVVDSSFQGQNSLSMESVSALYKDSLINSHPIKVPVKNPAEIASVFDSISYEKGAALIRMLESVLGKSSFRKGLKNYLTENAYGNAVTGDLWRAWQQVSTVKDLSVSEMMDTWTLQMGYPVVSVAWDSRTLHLSQERFIRLEKKDPEPEKEDFKSPFGCTYLTFKLHFLLAMWEQTGFFSLVPLPDGVDGDNVLWLKGNKDLNGFYRVNYDAKGWKKLTDQLKKDHTVFSVSDRIGLMEDAFCLAMAGHLNYSVVLGMVEYMSRETDYFVWKTVLPHLDFLSQRLLLEEEYDLLRDLALSVIRPRLEALGWSSAGDVTTRQLRKSVIQAAIDYEDQASIDRATDLFAEWKKNQNYSMNNELRYVAYQAGVTYGNKDDWDLVYDRYMDSNVASDKEHLQLALGTSRDVRVLQILLQYTQDSSKVKTQDSAQVVRKVARNRNGLLLAWRFLRQQWDLLMERYGVKSAIIRRMVLIVSNFNTKFDLDEVKEFFKDKELGSAARPLHQSVELIESHVVWSEKYMPEVKSWLQKNRRRR